MSKLVLFMPDGATVEVPLTRERTTIGRRADNDICLPDLAVSGEHAVVVTILADSFLEDLGSTNGTLVNGKAIAKHFLRDRDQVDIGRHKLIYCADDGSVIEGEVIRALAGRAAARYLGEVVDSARPLARAKRESHPSTLVTPEAPEPPRVGTEAAPPPVSANSMDDEPEPRQVPLQLSLPVVASVKVLTGINAGISVPLTKTETTIGRPGFQVAAIVRTGDLFVLKCVEGGGPLLINDQPVTSEGRVLAPGDIIAIAGTRIEFVAQATEPADNDRA